MNKLKLKILKYFVFCSLGISVAESMLDSTFYDLLVPKFGTDETSITLLYAANIMLSFVLIFIGACIFYHFVKKAIKAESRRQTHELNLIYSYIAHDLKTPMTSVQGFSSALKDGKIRPDEQGEILDIIYRKSRYMNELIETLSDYSRLGTESYSLSLLKVNLCILIRDIAAVNYSEFENKGIELEIDIPDEAVYCMLDEKEFRRAVNNLVVNAYTHNVKGTTVLIKVHTENGTVFVTVADNGEKLPQELVETMFEPFVSGSASRESGKGSGLGLAISARVAQMHGGRLYLSEDIEGYSKGFVAEVAAVA